MATNYVVSSRGDLDTLFKPRTSAAIAATGFLSNGGVDLAQRFEPRAATAAIANTGFLKAGTDLAQLFMDIAASGTVVTLDDVNWNATNTGANPAVSGYTLLTTGGIQRQQNGVSSAAGSWVAPSSAAPGTYQVRATVTAGTPPSGTLGVFTALSSGNQAWTLARTTPPSGTGTTSCTLQIEIRQGTGPVLDSAFVQLSATLS